MHRIGRVLWGDGGDKQIRFLSVLMIELALAIARSPTRICKLGTLKPLDYSKVMGLHRQGGRAREGGKIFGLGNPRNYVRASILS